MLYLDITKSEIAVLRRARGLFLSPKLFKVVRRQKIKKSETEVNDTAEKEQLREGEGLDKFQGKDFVKTFPLSSV
jgi:hypothetical protein